MANKYINKAFDLNGTGAITIYTVPAETVAIVKTVQAYNDTAFAVTTGMSLPLTFTFITFDPVLEYWRRQSLDPRRWR